MADVSYLMAMEKSKSTPAARASKKICLPDPSIKSVMVRYLDKHREITFEKIFHQKVGFLLFKEFCENWYDPELPVAQLQFYEDIVKVGSTFFFFRADAKGDYIQIFLY